MKAPAFTRQHSRPRTLTFGRFEVEVVLADDGLGVASLERGVADGAEGADGHQNVGNAQDVVADGKNFLLISRSIRSVALRAVCYSLTLKISLKKSVRSV